MATVSELLSIYENADALAEAEDALDRIAAMEPSEDLPLGDCYDGRRFAAELGSTEGSVAWPPGRNEPCWCGSGRKYKRCCG